MALYAIGDTHLSLTVDKPMDIFGGKWEGYVDKLRQGLSVLQPEDTLVLCGDISWGMSLEQAEADFAFLDSFPGRKLIVKGNHDYWWNTAAKMERFWAEKGFDSLHILHNNCYFYGNYALCGTRGWFYEEDAAGHNEKVFNRELIRLEASLKAAGEGEKLCFLHYPPRYQGYVCPEIITLLGQYGVKKCYYGHLHGASHRLAIEGDWSGIAYHLVAADYLQFRPVQIAE
ncbi:serine/threonine protein phosphatase [Pseudoflavonifractor sp. 524-17]|uniref:metallophosphoesterase n=1 Tax=Pseudoflavonifractor sp. 524-17 TaxID=2304577 RepID=UPI00137AF875|nr:serine/threonine protein phosphatase [Pseudoflavonifractor sp. 524-17]